jgi:aspartate/methionine/tyrosine aminotransferase
VFSRRIPDDLAANQLAAALAASRAERRPLLDLTASNPTRAGFLYPADLLDGLAGPRGLTYAPEPLGLYEARRAVSVEYARRGLRVSPDRIVLTTSTSEAYSLLFKILCNPGERVLVPRPSYPLFEHLTHLDAVIPVPYDLEYHGAWAIDLHSIEQGLDPQTRAVLVVHPNNPTGSFVSRRDGDAISRLCAECGAAIVADEVFAEYELTAGAAERAATFEASGALTFRLGGLSKSIGLPQVKLGWIAASGPDDLLGGAISRLEFACDAYLSVAAPVQHAAAGLLDRGAGIRRQIQERVGRNYAALRQISSSYASCQVLHAEAGWYAVLRVPAVEPEESLVLTLLREHQVLVHPGYFFDFPTEAYLVVSLLPQADEFDEAVRRIATHVEHRAAR